MALLTLTAGACSSPIEPTPPPPSLPSLTCPADVPAVSNDGNPIPVTYTVPTAVGGAQPVGVACAPPSGSSFTRGASSVTCTATDALARIAVCTFSVKVSVPPRLQFTKFMAFGDSLTEGKPSRIRAFDDFAGSYPSVLYPLLTARYVAQTVTMSKQGYGGEWTSTGVTRLSGLLAAERPEVLLLMEGSNDLSAGDPSAIAPALRNMEQMVVNAKASGANVFLATIPPQVAGSSSGRGYQIVPTYNDEIRRIATTQNVVLVDVFSALNSDLSAHMGRDGLHCTTAGYQKMADTFYATIQARLEIAGTTPTSGAFAPFGTRLGDGSPLVTGLKPRETADAPVSATPRAPRRRGR